MKDLIINIGSKPVINFNTVTLMFIRDVNSTKTGIVNYSNASGQVLTADQILYTSGVEGSLGYIKIISINNTVLNNTGTFNISVATYPTTIETNKSISINLFSNPSPLVINLIYNSKPVTTDITLETSNRTDRIIKPEDILPNVTDYDNDSISQIALFGNVSSIVYNNAPYIAGTYINMIDLTNNLLKCTALDQNESYTVNLQYRVKDSQGNTSN